MNRQGYISSLLVLSLVVFVFQLFAEDHSELIEGTFKTPQEVTNACLECHEDAAKEVMKTIHWTWSKDIQSIPGHKGTFELGKKNIFNNYCIATTSNWPRCTSCHAGYGWKDAHFDFSKEENVDCLVCHDHSGKYKKNPKGAGMPKEGVDLTAAAKSVGTPTNENCGACHFYGGGGENVKHGDLDHGLVNPERSYDVHMGSGMTCVDCHTTNAHQIKGESMAIVTGKENRIMCTDCHEAPVHNSKILNKHTEKIACQTCHIPVYAKGRPTKIWWDWSTAGKDSTAPKDKYGLPTYMKKKGSFNWGKNIKPELHWYNGTDERYLMGDKLNPNKVLSLNNPLGNVEDKNAKLFPFKVMRGKQIYDSKFNYLIVPHLWGGYWKDFDWNKAAAEGMKMAGLEYSGEYGFVETEMFWKVNHMVAPKEDALKCSNCHGKGKNKLIDWKALGYPGDQMYAKYRD